MCIVASPTNDMAIPPGQTYTYMTRNVKIVSFVKLHQSMVFLLRNINEEQCMTLAGLHSTLTSSLMQCNYILIKHASTVQTAV